MVEEGLTASANTASEARDRGEKERNREDSKGGGGSVQRGDQRPSNAWAIRVVVQMGTEFQTVDSSPGNCKDPSEFSLAAPMERTSTEVWVGDSRAKKRSRISAEGQELNSTKRVGDGFQRSLRQKEESGGV